MRLVMPPAYGGIKRYRDPSLCPSICLSHGAAALGYRHSGCLQLSHDCRPWTDVDPPRVELPSAWAYHLFSISSNSRSSSSIIDCGQVLAWTSLYFDAYYVSQYLLGSLVNVCLCCDSCSFIYSKLND